jgi:hypothetical protein
MSISTLKALLWLGTTAVLGYLGWSLYQWNENRAELTAHRSTAEIQRKWLDDVERPEPPKQEIHPYSSVQANFFELNWTGREEVRVEVPVVAEATEPVKPQAVPIDKLLKVLYVQVDTSQPQYSTALVLYKDATLSRAHPDPVNLVQGDALPDPHQLWVVAAIESGGVTFVRRTAEGEDDPEVEPQFARPATAFDGDLIVVVGEGGAAARERDGIPTAVPGTLRGPSKLLTEEVRPNVYNLGTDSMAQINENYLDILSTEVRTRSYRNPRTGEWQGIEILEVQPGSLAAQHGAQSGDVVKSINGHPVNSTQEAIQYVKNNKDAYDTWVVVVWNSGRERTITYNVP